MGFFGSITGSDGAKAAKNAGKTVTRGEEENQILIQKLQQSLPQQLEPFTKTESLANNRLLSILSGESSIQDDPLFSRTLDQALDTVDKRFAAGGKAFSGGRRQALRDTSIGAQNQFFDRLRSLATPVVTGNKLNLDVGLADRFNAHNTAAHGGLAAAQIGSANARTAGVNNLINIGKTALTAGNVGGFGV
jgi:hypothetical protein